MGMFNENVSCPWPSKKRGLDFLEGLGKRKEKAGITWLYLCEKIEKGLC